MIAFSLNATSYSNIALIRQDESTLRPAASDVSRRAIAEELKPKSSSSGKRPADYLVPDISEAAWKEALAKLGGPIVDVSMETLLLELAALPNILPESEQFLNSLPMLRKLAQLPEMAPLAGIMNRLEDRADKLHDAGLHNELQGSKGGLGILEGDSGEGYAKAILEAQVPGVKPFIIMPIYESRVFPKTDYDEKRQRLPDLPVHYDRLIDYSDPVDYRRLVDPNVFTYPELEANGGGEKLIKPLVDEDGSQIKIITSLCDPKDGTMKRVETEILVVSRGGTPVLLLRCPEVENILYTDNEAERLNQQVLVGQVVPELCKRLGIKPAVLRLNEAHTVVAMAKMMEDEYFNDVTYIFTNHTPVVAGLQVYYGKAEWFNRLGLSPDFRDIFVDSDGNLNFSLAAMKLCHLANGVSKPHGVTLRDMFPGYVIKGILNGTGEFWKSDALKRAESEFDELSPSQLLNIHKQDKAALIDFIERRTSERERPGRSARPGARLDPEMPIIGLVRRITFYKQQYPMLKDTIRALCQDKGVESTIVIDGETIEVEGLGMQIVVGGIIVREGDEEMQDWIREFITWMDDPAFKGRFVFVSGNDVELMKAIAAGSDAWVEMPQRIPETGHQKEACGTSGMRAFENGNVPITSSGMWGEEVIEQYDPETGRGNGFILDKITPKELFDALVVVSDIFYKWRDEDDDRWPNLRKRAYEDAKALYIKNAIMRYVLELFLPAQEAMRAERSIRKLGPVTPDTSEQFECKAGDEILICANISLNDPGLIDNFEAQIWTNINGHDRWEAIPMSSRRRLNAGTFRFSGIFETPRAGDYGYKVRFQIKQNGKYFYAPKGLGNDGKLHVVENPDASGSDTVAKASSAGGVDAALLADLMVFDQRASEADIEDMDAYHDLKSVFDAELPILFVRHLRLMYETIESEREIIIAEYENSEDGDVIDLVSMPHARILADMLMHIVGNDFHRRTRLEDYLNFAVEAEEVDVNRVVEMRNVIMNNFGVGEIIEATTEYSPVYPLGGVATVMAQYPSVAGRRYGLDVKVGLPLYQFIYDPESKQYRHARDEIISQHNIRWSGRNIRIYIDGKYETVGVYNAYINGHVVIFYDHPLSDSVYIGHKGDGVTDEDRALRRVFLSKATLETVIEFRKNPRFLIGNDDWAPFIGFYQREHKRYREYPATARAVPIMRWHNPVYGNDIPYRDGETNIFRLIAEDPDNPDLIRHATTKRWELEEAFRHPGNPDRISCRAIAARYSHNLAVSKGLASSMITTLGGTYLHDVFASRPMFGIHEAIDQHTLQRRIFGDHFVLHLKEWRACTDPKLKAQLERELLRIMKEKKHLAKGTLLFAYFSHLFGVKDRLLHTLGVGLDKYFGGHLVEWVDERMTRMEKATHMPVFFYIGRWSRMKGLHFLLEHLEGDNLNILERLIQLYPDIKFVFAGGASAGDEFGWRVFHALKGIEHRYPDNVVVRGPVKHGSDEWHALMAASDGGQVPSLREPCGMVPLEMESAGVPVVAANVEGLIDGVTDVRYHANGNGFKFEVVRTESGDVDDQKTARGLYTSIVHYLDIYFYHNGTRGENEKMDRLMLNCVTTDNRWSPRIEEFIDYLRSLAEVDPLVALSGETSKSTLAIPDITEASVETDLGEGQEYDVTEEVPRPAAPAEVQALSVAINSAA